MAVPEQTPYIEHTGNGVTTSFALKFQCESKGHLIVLIDDIEPPIASWSLVGGNVVFTTAPVAGTKITLQRNTPFDRTTDYQSFNNSFRPQTVNGDFDRLWLKLQELGVADWLMKLYVDRLHQQQEDKIDNLKIYVDDKDDELRAYLMEEIRKQGVALDQLDDYYNYLMQRLAQIAVDKGWDASFVVDGDKNQHQINKDQAQFNETLELNVINFFTKAELQEYKENPTAFDSYEPMQRGVFAANALGRSIAAFGEFYISQTLLVSGSIDFSQARIHTDVENIGIDIRMFDYSYLRDATVRLPGLINKNKVDGDKWENTTAIGVRTVNLDACTIYTGHIWNFETNLKVFATNSKGNCYSTYHVGHLQNGKINIDIQAEGFGWANENLFIGGRYSHLTAEGVLTSGVRHIRIGAGGEYVPNQNTFIKASLEGRISEYVVENSGNYNFFEWCRWESNTLPRVLYKKFTEMSTAASQATRNVISGGYQSDSIQVVNEGTGGAFANTLESSFIRSMVMQGSDAGFKLKNVGSDTSVVFRVYSASDGDMATPTISLNSRQISGKRFTDAFDRARVDFYNGRLYLGNGTGEPASYLQGTASSILSSAPLNPLVSESLGLGTSSARWRDLFLSGGVGFFGSNAPTDKPLITGKKSPTSLVEQNAVIDSIVAALSAYGLVSDDRT